MDDDSISRRTTVLRQEVEEIRRANLRYFAKTGHSPSDRTEHEKRHARVIKIREELLLLMKTENERR